MENLENYGVQALDVKEMRETAGGIWPIIIGALIGVALTQDLDDLKAAFWEGYNS